MPTTGPFQTNLLRLKQVQAQTGLGRSSIYNLIGDGDFPAPVKITKRAVAWPQQSINDWVASRVSTAKTA